MGALRRADAPARWPDVRRSQAVVRHSRAAVRRTPAGEVHHNRAVVRHNRAAVHRSREEVHHNQAVAHRAAARRSRGAVHPSAAHRMVHPEAVRRSQVAVRPCRAAVRRTPAGEVHHSRAAARRSHRAEAHRSRRPEVRARETDRSTPAASDRRRRLRAARRMPVCRARCWTGEPCRSPCPGNPSPSWRGAATLTVRVHLRLEVAWSRSTRSGLPYPVGHCGTGRIASLGGSPRVVRL